MRVSCACVLAPTPFSLYVVYVCVRRCVKVILDLLKDGMAWPYAYDVYGWIF